MTATNYHHRQQQQHQKEQAGNDCHATIKALPRRQQQVVLMSYCEPAASEQRRRSQFAGSVSCQSCLSILAADERARHGAVRRRRKLKTSDLHNLEQTLDSSSLPSSLSRSSTCSSCSSSRPRLTVLLFRLQFVVLLLLLLLLSVLLVFTVPAASTSPNIYSSSSSSFPPNNRHHNKVTNNNHNNLFANNRTSSSSSSSRRSSSSNNRKRRNNGNANSGSSSSSSQGGSAGTVATNLGLVQGHLSQLPNTNIEVYEFLGIPYAEPPVGERRFRKPVPKQPWRDILDATRRPNSCPQLLDTLFDTFDGAAVWNANTDMAEDCLYLNIWVPRRILDDLSRSRTSNRDQRGLHPVLVWIFGGGFTSGTATLDLYDGRVLAGYNNLIVASMQYRLGALGFLYFGIDDAPGNMGLWDQMLALKWLCENVHNFGGDCRNTTIFGESAGAASVSFHLLSPYSRDYFQRAIMQSASSLSGWAVLTQEEATWRSNELVTKFAATCSPPPSSAAGGSSDTSGDSPSPQAAASPQASSKIFFDETRWKIDCLRSQQFLRLPEEEWGVLASDPAGYAQFPFVPVIDGDFVPRHPRDLLADGQYYNVSILLGLNRNEGSYFMLYTTKGYQLFKHPRAPNKQMNFTTRIYSDLIRDFFAYYPHFNRTSSQVVLDAIEFEYTPWRLPVITSQDIISAVDSATGDWAFGCPVVSWADSYVELPPAPMAPALGTRLGDDNGGGVVADDPKNSKGIAPTEETEEAPLANDDSSVRYVRLKRSFASGFSYLQQPTGNQDQNNAANAGQGGGPTVQPAMRNPDSIYSSIPENDLWYSKHKVFLYHFTQRSSVHSWPAWMGVLHGDEINFVFGEPFNFSRPYTDEEKMLTRYIMAYWSNFAKFGDPNVRDRSSPNQLNLELPAWPEYSYYEKTFLDLSVDTLVTKRQPAVGSSIKAQECAFWHGYLPKLDALSVIFCSERELPMMMMMMICIIEFLCTTHHLFASIVLETESLCSLTHTLHPAKGTMSKIEAEWRKSFHYWKYNALPEWQLQFRRYAVVTSSKTPSKQQKQKTIYGDEL